MLLPEEQFKRKWLQQAAITWYRDFNKTPNGNTAPAGITIDPYGTVLSNSLTLNVTVYETTPTVAGNYYFTVTVDGVESAVKTLTVGNSATFTGATLDSTYYSNTCLIINNLDNIEFGSTFDLKKLTYSDGVGGNYQLKGLYTNTGDASVPVKGNYYYNNSDTLIIALTDEDITGISILGGSGSTDKLSAASGWNISNGVLANPVINAPVIVQ